VTTDIDYEATGPARPSCSATTPHHQAAHDVWALWDDVREQWFTTGMTGPALYDYAVARAKDMGWELNLDLSGHRLGDFPHEALYGDLLLDDQSFGG
jgi:hypothetical protein